MRELQWFNLDLRFNLIINGIKWRLVNWNRVVDEGTRFWTTWEFGNLVRAVQEGVLEIPESYDPPGGELCTARRHDSKSGWDS